MSSSSITTTVTGDSVPKAGPSPEAFMSEAFGPSPDTARKQPWKDVMKVQEEHYIHVVSDNLRLWGKHVAAHS